MTSPQIPTTVLGRSSPLHDPRPDRPVDETVLGPTSWIGERAWADAVQHLVQPPRRPSCTPAYYLGRSAEVWLDALAPERDELAA
jgi:hypothetical protein